MAKCEHTIKQRDVAAIRECTLCLQAEVERLKRECEEHRKSVGEVVKGNQEVYDYLYERGIKWPKNLLDGVKKFEQALKERGE